MKITKVKINGITNPMGFAYEYLSCSWEVKDANSRCQEYARIEVSESEVFDSTIYIKEGKDLKQSGEPLEIILNPRTTYYYRVTVTGDHGDQGISDIYTFETGKMNEEWQADWISAQKNDSFHPILVRKFEIKKALKRVRFYATGLGLFEVYLNGEKVGNEYLAPLVTNYEKRIQVWTFSLDGKIKKQNILEIMLAKGWYMGKFGLASQIENYGNRMAAIGELHLEYEDGSYECLVTDENWQYYGSDIEASDIYDGEFCNRLLWSEKVNRQKPVEVLRDPQKDEGTKNLDRSKLMDRLSLPVIAKEEVSVKSIIQTPAGETVLDMGQNFAGFVEFKSNLPRGTKIVMDCGEILQEQNFYNENYRDAKSQFIYIADGVEEIVRPHFTYFGFRYIRVTGWVGELKKEDFIGKVLYSDIDRTGYLQTSNSKINRLYENTVWGLKSNFLDIPTDCPQRSERLGWTGDAQVFAPTASYHMDTRAFFHKFIMDLRDEQIILKGGVPNFIPNLGHKEEVASVWGDIATFLPNTLFHFYGDFKEIEYSYPLMKEWVDYIDNKDAKRGRQYLFNFGGNFGDWLALDGPTPTSFKGSTDDYYIASVYYYRSVQIVSEMAERLGRQQEASNYQKLESEIKNAIFTEYFTPSGRLAIDTQAAYIIALKFGIYLDRGRLIDQFKRRLKKDCQQIKCGFVGAPLLCTVLGEIGLHEVAYDFLLKEGFPSWLYSVNLGATTIWERWNSVMPDGKMGKQGMNSLNHYAYGSVMEFVYGYVVGIRPLEPGFKKAMIAPCPDIRLKSVSGAYNSVNGEYISNWQIEEDGHFSIHLEIPFNCEAKVILPEYLEGNMVLEAGTYDFRYKPIKDFRKPYHPQTTLSRLAKDSQALDILYKYTPAIGNITASVEAEMGANTLADLFSMAYLPFDPVQLQLAAEEIYELHVAGDSVMLEETKEECKCYNEEVSTNI